MYLLVLALILTVMKWQEIGPVSEWSWWWVLLPYALTVAWWSWADWSGYTKRKAMEKAEERKQERIQRQREAMQGPTHRRRR